MWNLFKYELFSRWVAILSWGIGLAAFASMYIAIYPEVAGEMQGIADLGFYRALGMDIGTFAGYMASVVVQFLPLFLGVYVIMASTATLAGEEDNGTLEIVVAMPLHRWQIVLMKAAALAIVLLLIFVLMGVGSAFTLDIVRQSTDVDVTPLQLFTALLNVYPIALAFFSMGLFLGTVMPSRRMAVATVTVIYIASYVVNSAANMVDSLGMLQRVSLFNYVDTSADTFRNGIQFANVSLLLLMALVFLALAVWGFGRRNLTVGQWPWQRSRAPINETA